MSVSSVSSTNPTASSTTAPSGSSSLGSGLDTTFMTLLMAELKSQDPTAPMDTTAMVGQMVSLNSLNELIGIHQLLQNGLSGTTANNSSSQTSSGAN